MATTRVQLPDGNIGEFPAGMSQDQIQSVLAKQFPPSVNQPEQPGFLENLGHAFGIGKQEQADRMAHPIKTALEELPGVAPIEGAVKGAGRIGGELVKAFQSGTQGNSAGVAEHAIKAIPFVGDVADRGSQALQPFHGFGDAMEKTVTNPGILGTVAGEAPQAAMAVEAGLEGANPGRTGVYLPTRSGAGKIFESVMQDAQHEPITLTRAMGPLERAQQLSARGHGTVSAADNLYKRINTVNPLDYREGRDWASSLSRISGQDSMSASPSLKAEVGKLSHAFNEDIGDAATAVGRGEDYSKAMRDYRRASQIGDAAKKAGNIAKWAVPAAAGGGMLTHVLRKATQ